MYLHIIKYDISDIHDISFSIKLSSSFLIYYSGKRISLKKASLFMNVSSWLESSIFSAKNLLIYIKSPGFHKDPNKGSETGWLESQTC